MPLNYLNDDDIVKVVCDLDLMLEWSTIVDDKLQRESRIIVDQYFLKDLRDCNADFTFATSAKFVMFVRGGVLFEKDWTRFCSMEWRTLSVFAQDYFRWQVLQIFADPGTPIMLYDKDQQRYYEYILPQILGST